MADPESPGAIEKECRDIVIFRRRVNLVRNRSSVGAPPDHAESGADPQIAAGVFNERPHLDLDVGVRWNAEPGGPERVSAVVEAKQATVGARPKGPHAVSIEHIDAIGHRFGADWVHFETRSEVRLVRGRA